jgi:REG-2-like HAD superfamily hydrolase
MFGATLQRALWFLITAITVSKNSALALSVIDDGGTRKSSRIRAISLDVTGTLVATQEPVLQSYYEAALWAQLPNPPTLEEMKPAFKSAYKERCLESPCFGGVEGISGRDWWRATVRRVLEHASSSTTYTEQEFDRYFRRVYQHFGSPNGYRVLDDAAELLTELQAQHPDLLLGITSNTPTRHMESVLPMLNVHDSFSWFTCSQDVGHEKPSAHIFDDAFQQARFWIPDLLQSEILHIGDSLACDYCGAKAVGWQALLLDRSDHPNVTVYQDWITAPDYAGKSEEDIQQHTISNLMDVIDALQ